MGTPRQLLENMFETHSMIVFDFATCSRLHVLHGVAVNCCGMLDDKNACDAHLVLFGMLYKGSQ